MTYLSHKSNKKILWKIVLWGLVFVATTLTYTYAADTMTWSVTNTNTWAASSIQTKPLRKKIIAKPRPLLMQTFLHDVCTRVGQWSPSVYKQVAVNRPSVKKDTTLYDALQKCIYLWVLESTSKVNNLWTPVNGDFVIDFLLKKFSLSLPKDIGSETITQNFWNEEIRYRIPTYYGVKRLLELSSRGTNGAYESSMIQSPYFQTVAWIFNTLQKEYHYLSGGINEEEIMYGAIKWMVDALHDSYSVYFPAEESLDFLNSIQWEIYGIWVYVEVVDWYFTILSTLKDSPAEAAWLQPWDRVIAVDDWQVPTTFTLGQVTKRIKWPEWTPVTLTIERMWVETKYTLKRKKISAPLLKTEYQNNAMIFTISSFGMWLDTQFQKEMQIHKDNIKQAKKIILDLRGNGGWYTDVALHLMENFVNSGNILIQNEWWYGNEIIMSNTPELSPFTWKDIYILIDRGSASASEQLAWVIKEYYPTTKLVGEKSFGKGSMQTIVWLPNAWSVKYTVALWYIWASRTSIEKVWLTPDILLKDDTKTPRDEVLDAVLWY